MSLPIKKPALFWYLTEGIRGTWQLLWCYFFVRRHRAAQQGDGHPVVVVPGFLGSDLSTTLLRKFVEQLGYTVYGWDLGRNLGDLSDLQRLADRVETIHQQHGRQVTLIGWSLGGIYIRECAKMNVTAIRQLITLGSPFADLNAPNHARWIFDLIRKGEALDQDWIAKIAEPVPVRTTCLYSKHDGIVPWQACMEKKTDALHQNIEVKSSHVGFVGNVGVFRVVEGLLLSH